MYIYTHTNIRRRGPGLRLLHHHGRGGGGAPPPGKVEIHKDNKQQSNKKQEIELKLPQEWASKEPVERSQPARARERRFVNSCPFLLFRSPVDDTANLPTDIVDFAGFNSSIILNLRGGVLMSIGDFRESLSQAMLVGVMLVGGLGVVCWGKFRRGDDTVGNPCRAQISHFELSSLLFHRN